MLVDMKDTVVSTPAQKGDKGDRGEPGLRGPSGADVSVTKTHSVTRALHLMFYHFLCNIRTVDGKFFKCTPR